MPEDKKNNGGAKQQKAGTKIDKKAHYLSRKESRDIVKANKKAMKELQQKQLRHVTEDKYTTQMKDEGNLVEFENLHTYFFTDAGISRAVNGVSFNIPEGSVVGIVGESGCGKSVTSLSLMRLVQAPQGQTFMKPSRTATAVSATRWAPSSTSAAIPCSIKTATSFWRPFKRGTFPARSCTK